MRFMHRGALFAFAFVLIACGSQYLFDDSSIDSSDLAQEYAEGRAMLETVEADPCLQDAMAGVPPELSRCDNASNSSDSDEDTGSDGITSGCVTASALTIRSGPGTEYPTLGYLRRGDCLDLLGRSSDGNWARIGEGWVSVRYLEISGSPQSLASDGSLAPAPPPRSEEQIGCPNGCTSRPPGCDIKGNISINTGEKIYHVPGQEYYDETIIRPEYGERWFCTEGEATANGWRKAEV